MHTNVVSKDYFPTQSLTGFESARPVDHREQDVPNLTHIVLPFLLSITRATLFNVLLWP